MTLILVATIFTVAAAQDHARQPRLDLVAEYGDAKLRLIKFWDPPNGIMLTSRRIFRSANAGRNWTEIPGASDGKSAYQDAAISSDRVWLLSRDRLLNAEEGRLERLPVPPLGNYGGEIVGIHVRESDASIWLYGATYRVMEAGEDGPNNAIKKLQDGRLAILVPLILVSRDGGMSWERILPLNKSGLDSGSRIVKLLSVGDSTLIAGTDYRILESDDDGQTWNPAELRGFACEGPSHLDGDLRSLDLLGDGDFLNQGWFSASDGSVYKTENGLVWCKTLRENLESALESIRFRSPHQGIATDLKGRLMWTQDGGQNWSQVLATESGFSRFEQVLSEDHRHFWALTTSALYTVTLSEQFQRTITDPQ